MPQFLKPVRWDEEYAILEYPKALKVGGGIMIVVGAMLVIGGIIAAVFSKEGPGMLVMSVAGLLEVAAGFCMMRMKRRLEFDFANGKYGLLNVPFLGSITTEVGDRSEFSHIETKIMQGNADGNNTRVFAAELIFKDPAKKPLPLVAAPMLRNRAEIAAGIASQASQLATKLGIELVDRSGMLTLGPGK